MFAEELSTLKEVGIGISALIVLGVVVRYFLIAMRQSREDFCRLMSNHIEHNTKAIEGLDKTLEKNTNMLDRISHKLK